MEQAIIVTSTISLILLSIYVYRMRQNRSANDVAIDVLEEWIEGAKRKEKGEVRNNSKKSKKQSGPTELSLVHIIGGLVAYGGIFTFLTKVLAVEGLMAGLLAAILMSVPLLLIVVLSKRGTKDNTKEIEFNLPLVMERLVMAVTAGQDIVRAMGTIVKLAREEDELDPITEMLEKVLEQTENGVRFEEALRTVVADKNIPALKHAFMYIGHAYKEGGSVARPLQELSDSTQVMFQNKINAEIKKLPFKGLGPVMLSYMGLLIILCTVPFVSLLNYAGEAQQGFTHQEQSQK